MLSVGASSSIFSERLDVTGYGGANPGAACPIKARETLYTILNLPRAPNDIFFFLLVSIMASSYSSGVRPKMKL